MDKPIILIVDDSVTLRASVRAILESSGYKVYEAENGQKGIEKLKEIYANNEKVSLIFSDIYMPVMDGIEFIKTVKQSEFKFIPIIVLTTESQNEMKMKGKEAGAAGWLLKPFSPEMLIKVAKKFIRT